jgi:predicted phage baseplate assembly protein
VLLVEPPGGPIEHWTEVADFGDSGPSDRHFTLDSTDGTLTLGPSLLQPDGTVYRFGAVPPRGSALRFSRYQCGGGSLGNVPKGIISVLKSSIPYVAGITNRQPGINGRDAQSLDELKLRTPQMLRTRTRAVTADDFETLARKVPGVDRAHCLAPGAQPGAAGLPKPGEVVVLVLPQVDRPHEFIAPERLTLAAELKQAVESELNERRLVGTRLSVQAPHVVWVSIEASVRLPERTGASQAVEVRRRAERELYRYLNPYVGGPAGTGWPFGRELHVSELYALLQRIPGIEYIDELRVEVSEPGSSEGPQVVSARLPVPPRGVICSHVHRVNRA